MSDKARAPADRSERSPGRVAPPWFLGQKIAVPDHVAGHLDRAELADRTMPTRRRLTVLQAPGGFGKTTLLAECCRRLREEGVPTAWVTIDEQDEPGILDTYIACACHVAVSGSAADLETVAASDMGQVGAGPESRIGVAMRGIAEVDGPFVLVFDELERIASAGASRLLALLLERGPPNLHLAFGCRQLPAGVNVAGAVLEGRAVIASADELRFSRDEVAAFFGGKLPRARLDALLVESAGWPFALRIARSEADGSRRTQAATGQFVDNWVESRLFAGLGTDEREFLLDIGLFEWMDPALLDEVLERSDSMHRIDTMPLLAGMLEPVKDGTTAVWRLHPLIREHCTRRRFQETPERFLTVHRRLAEALERRGQTVAAMRHAVEAGEPGLAGDVLERAGGALLHSRLGTAPFLAADRVLSEDLVAARPRLGLSRCLATMLSGRMQEALERYAVLAPHVPRLRDDADDDASDLHLAAEHCVVRGMLGLYSGERLVSLQREHLPNLAMLARSPRIDPPTRGVFAYALGLANSMRARFGPALQQAARARQWLGRNTNTLMYTDVLLGQIAMAQGRVESAATHYRLAEQAATGSHGPGSEAAVICTVLRLELALECGRAPRGADQTGVPEALMAGATPLQAYAAASGAAVDLALWDTGVAGALAAVDGMLEYVRGARLPALARHVSALKASVLATAGRFADAERAWMAGDLPRQAADCLDLTGQTWRELESLCCARLRLDIGRGRFEEARRFGEDLRAVADGHELRRTVMRALALSIVLELRAGANDAAAELLHEYLRLYSETPYAGPLVREREDCAPLVDASIEAAPDAAA